MPGTTDLLTERLARGRDVVWLRRPIHPGSASPTRTFDLAYARVGRRGGPALLVLPGGPGIASAVPYRGFRRRAAAKGFDVVMVEHRGVGLSRTDRYGRDLPMEALTVSAVVDDLAAVLDACGLEKVVIYGTSYGGYLAQAFGARYPDRVSGMVLDSTNSAAHDYEIAREHVRRLLWRGDELTTAAVAARLRAMVEHGLIPTAETGSAIPETYEVGGARLVRQLLESVVRGHQEVWKRLVELGDKELIQPRRYVLEFDLAGAINFRELYALRPDGGPLDPAVGYAKVADRFPEFTGDPFPLYDATPEFRWPTVVVSGARDMRTPRPVAKGIAERIPTGVLLPFDGLAHSILDTHPRAALHIAHAVAEGTHTELPARASRLERLPRPAAQRAMPTGIGAALALGRLRPT